MFHGRNPGTTLYVVGCQCLSHYLQGLIPFRWCRISFSTVFCPFFSGEGGRQASWFIRLCRVGRLRYRCKCTYIFIYTYTYDAHISYIYTIWIFKYRSTISSKCKIQHRQVGLPPIGSPETSPSSPLKCCQGRRGWHCKRSVNAKWWKKQRCKRTQTWDAILTSISVVRGEQKDVYNLELFFFCKQPFFLKVTLFLAFFLKVTMLLMWNLSNQRTGTIVVDGHEFFLEGNLEI